MDKYYDSETVHTLRLATSTVIKVGSCNCCPMMHFEDKTHQATCTHPEVDGDDPENGVYGRLIGGMRGDPEHDTVQAWCPMHRWGKAERTVIMLTDALFFKPKTEAHE